MRALFDTSVLVAASVEGHSMHARALPWLRRAHAGEIDFHVAAHSLAECYAVLTAIPTRPRITPPTAARILHDNIESKAKIVALTASDYRRVVHDLSRLGLAGGVVYDAIVARCAAKVGVEILLTLNPDHFIRVWPEGEDIVSAP
jgi:predicted nucleic acid-binding protein